MWKASGNLQGLPAFSATEDSSRTKNRRKPFIHISYRNLVAEAAPWPLVRLPKPISMAFHNRK
jgi:hypothetical protein